MMDGVTHCPSVPLSLTSMPVLCGLYGDFVARGRYLEHGPVITSHSILWDVITYPCPKFLPLVPKSSCFVIVLQIWSHVSDKNNMYRSCVMRQKPVIWTKKRQVIRLVDPTIKCRYLHIYKGNLICVSVWNPTKRTIRSLCYIDS